MAGQGQSEHTEEKQYGLSKILGQWLSIVDRITTKYKIDRPILYADMNAGSGWNEEVNCIGSPLLFLNEAKTHTFKRDVYFIESNTNALIELAERVYEVGELDANLINGNHNEVMPEIVKKHNGLGLIYHDPNGLPSFDLLRSLSQFRNFDKVDILIRISGTNYKRIRNGVDSFGKKRQILELIGKYPNLKDQLKSINKKQWIIRDIIDPDPYQWTFLLGTNWTEYKAWESQGFYKIDSSKGAAILNRVSHTIKELGEFGNGPI